MKRGAQGARIVIERVRSVELHSGRAFCKSNYARVITAQWSARVNVSIKRKRKKTRGGGSVKGGKGERRKKAKGYGEGNREKEALKSRVFDTYAQLRIGFKRKLGRYKSSVPSSITNIDLNHKDRPRYSIVGARLIVQFLLSSFRCQPLPLCLFLSFHFFSPPSSFSSLFSFSFFVSLFSSFLFFFFFFLFFFFVRQRPINPLIPRGLCATCGVPARRKWRSRWKRTTSKSALIIAGSWTIVTATVLCERGTPLSRDQPGQRSDAIIFAKFAEMRDTPPPLPSIGDCLLTKWDCQPSCFAPARNENFGTRRCTRWFLRQATARRPVDDVDTGESLSDIMRRERRNLIVKWTILTRKPDKLIDVALICICKNIWTFSVIVINY